MSIRLHVNDIEKQDGHQPGRLLHRSYWLHGVPRIMVLCRLFGHRPVVDGYDSSEGMTRESARWVACDRCGVRPDPQGDLEPARWLIGQHYTGPYSATVPPPKARAVSEQYVRPNLPGPWPTKPTGTVGAELVIGRSFSGAGVQLKVGNAGSEHILAAHIRINPIGALYLHTERHGTWLQRRLNPRGYESRVFDLGVHDGTLSWKLWAKRDSWTRGTPRWQDGSTVIDPRDRWLGPVRHDYENVGPSLPGRVAMPEGDTHDVQLQLQKVRTGRRRGRMAEWWSVDWECRLGIPFRNHSWKGDGVNGSAVTVSAAAIERGRWPEEACALIAASVAKDRSRYGWRPAVPYDWPVPDYNTEYDIEVD